MRLVLCRLTVLLTLPAICQLGHAQMIPDVATLMRQVQTHQRDLDVTRENYTYRERQTIDELDKNGALKKHETRELQVFFANSHRVERLVKRDGKPLSPGEDAKETDRVKKEIEKAENTPPGQLTDDKTQISVSRMLNIEKFDHGRRIQMDNRPVLVFDFVGDPQAKTHGMAEEASKKLTGTLWVDEQDRQVRRLQAQLHDNMHMGFGIFSVSKGSTFSFDQKLINNELWLPTSASVHLEAHAIAFLSYRANIQIVDDDYKRFHTNTEQQEGTPVGHRSRPT